MCCVSVVADFLFKVINCSLLLKLYKKKPEALIDIMWREVQLAINAFFFSSVPLVIIVLHMISACLWISTFTYIDDR